MTLAQREAVRQLGSAVAFLAIAFLFLLVCFG
jgi:hypothetical protein